MVRRPTVVGIASGPSYRSAGLLIGNCQRGGILIVRSHLVIYTHGTIHSYNYVELL